MQRVESPSGSREPNLCKIMENKYTIICTLFTYGSITKCVNKEEVRKECERLKKICKIGMEKCYQTIEVINNETGEIREYWNNHNNKINF